MRKPKKTGIGQNKKTEEKELMKKHKEHIETHMFALAGIP